MVVENAGSNPVACTMKKEYIEKEYFYNNLHINIKAVEGYPEYYVDKCGEVYSKYKNGKILKLQKRINKGGYYYVNLCVNAKYKSIGIHRLVGKYFIDNPNNLVAVNHKDCNKLNNSSYNLEFVTNQENSKHAYENGLLKIAKGVECNLTKLTEQEVKEIRDLEGKLTQEDIALRYNVSRGNISQIHKRITWKHI